MATVATRTWSPGLRWIWALLALLTLLAAAQPLCGQEEGSGADPGGYAASEPEPAPAEPPPEPAPSEPASSELAPSEAPPAEPPASGGSPSEETPGEATVPPDGGSATPGSEASADDGQPAAEGAASSEASAGTAEGAGAAGSEGAADDRYSGEPESQDPAASDDELAAGGAVDPSVEVYRTPEYPALSGSREATDLEAVPPDSPNQPMTMEEARQLVRAAGENAQSQGFSPNYTTDGCFWRAHLYEEEAQNRGYQPERIFIVTGQEDPEKPAKWGYHTAMVLPVVGDDGVPRRMVFDPALSSDPIRMADWSANEIPGERSYGADVPVKAGQQPYAYVSVAPGSTSDPRNFYPASGRPAEIVPREGQTRASANQEVVDGVRAFANQRYEDYYPRGADGSYHPDRFLWSPAGGPSSSPSVVASAP